MRKKPQAKPEPVVPAEILELAKQSISEDRLKKVTKCSVCGTETAAETVNASPEPLCWVCRRLKISAWHEIEQQLPAQE